MLAALLVSSAAGIIVTLFGSMNTLLKASSAPDFAQMHSGELDQKKLDGFATEHENIVRSQQTISLLNVGGANIYMGNNEMAETNSVMENAFVTQSKKFDFLLDLDNEVLEVKDGEIAIPLYHMQEYDLELGDTVRVVGDGVAMKFTIVSFLRDSLNNPSLINSKRFLVSENDWNVLKENIGTIEYMVEFQFNDLEQETAFETLYQNSDMPQKGPAMTNSLVTIINAMSGGISAAVIILIGILLVVIAALCLRFTMAATIEEDYREIGVMKAIGMPGKKIRKLYMMKYVAIAGVAVASGYVLSLLVGRFFTANIALYMGTAQKTIWNSLIPLLGAAVVFIFVVVFCILILRRFRKISAVEAIRTGASPLKGKNRQRMKLYQSKFADIHMFLGIREVLNRFRVYGLLCFIFIICTFLIVVPLNFLNTLNSPQFITYMGAGQCDIRLDLQSTNNLSQSYEDIETYIENDPDVTKHTALFTSMYQVKNAEGDYDNIKIEVGDFSVFPLDYAEGTAPDVENEIALSSMNAEELAKGVGDKLSVMVGQTERELTVCGIYQDVTNGGKTAKAILPIQIENILWLTLNLDVNEHVTITDKIEEYKEACAPAKVTDVDNYIGQTMGSIIDQLQLVVTFGFALSLFIAMLITAMFFKMLIAKDAKAIAVMRGLGISIKDIRRQYITRAIIALLVGMILGSVAAVTLGQGLAGVILAGISSMKFVINPWMSFIICPLALAAVVGFTVYVGCAAIRKVNIMLVAE
jgi:putative ABC transport system permease protein